MKKPKSQKSLTGKTVIHIVTGSIAAYKAGDLVQALREEGVRVVCVLTDSAKQFVTPLVLRALSGERVYHEFFAEDTPYDVLHTSLAEEADLVLVSPASADFISKLAVGAASDLASCIVLATVKPVLIAPAMNDQMYQHSLTQKNINILRQTGYQFIDPVEGHLVCGKEAIGHIADTEEITAQVRQILQKKIGKR